MAAARLDAAFCVKYYWYVCIRRSDNGESICGCASACPDNERDIIREFFAALRFRHCDIGYTEQRLIIRPAPSSGSIFSSLPSLKLPNMCDFFCIWLCFFSRVFFF